MNALADKKKKINNMVLTIVFLAYLIFNGILLMRHELWRDEANVWLIARELSPIQLFQEIRYQGHPCLWYLIVMPVAKSGLPFQSVGVLSLVVMAVTAGLFLWKAPFHTPIKAMCVLSPVFTYFYADIARNYCLIALFLILLAWNYPRRNEKSVRYGMLLGLLVQADTIAIAAAGMISLMWLWENGREAFQAKNLMPVRRILKGIWIPLASFLLWVAQFHRVSDSPAFHISGLGMSDLFREIRNYSLWILERMTGQEQSFCIIFLGMFLALLAVTAVKIKNSGAVWVLISSYLFVAVFSVVVYQLHLWHFISLCFVLIWTMWVLDEQKNEKMLTDRISRQALGGMQVLLLILSVCMFLQWNSQDETSSLNNALYGLYSDGVHTAEFIEENISEQEVIVSANVSMASTVLAYLPDYQFYFAGTGRITSYADYSTEQERRISFGDLCAWAQTNFPGRKEIYLLDTQGSCIVEREGLEKCEVLYRTQQETARGEEYTVYRISL